MDSDRLHFHMRVLQPHPRGQEQVRAAWREYQKTEVTSDKRVYHLLSLNCSLSQFFDMIWKDFWEMLAHYVIIIALLSTTWIINFFRISLPVLRFYDGSSVFLEIAKCSKNACGQSVSGTPFHIFGACWILMQLYMFIV